MEELFLSLKINLVRVALEVMRLWATCILKPYDNFGGYGSNTPSCDSLSCSREYELLSNVLVKPTEI